MRGRAGLLAMALGIMIGSAAQADQLRGRVSGLAEPDARVDIRVRFFDADEGPLADRQFDGVRLVNGTFELSVDASAAPAAAASVEIALRPAARHYAVFQPIQPRRPIRRVHHGIRVASISPEHPAVPAPTSNEFSLVATGAP